MPGNAYDDHARVTPNLNIRRMVTIWIIKCMIHGGSVALFVLAFNACFWEGMIFGRIGSFIETTVPQWIYKPLVGCPICMSFWYGFLAEITLFDLGTPLAPFMAMGICSIIVRIENE